MAIKSRFAVKRQIILYSLTDMFFILLMFYLCVKTGMPGSGVDAKPVTNPKPESASLISKVTIPEPDKIGKINALLQVLASNRYLWLDLAAIDDYSHSASPGQFEQNHTYNMGHLQGIITDFKKAQAKDNSLYCHVLVRYPDSLDYKGARQIIELLSTTRAEDAKFNSKLQLSVIGYRTGERLKYVSTPNALEIQFGSF